MNKKLNIRNVLLFLVLIRPAMDMFVSVHLFSFGILDINVARLWGILFILLSSFYLISKRVNLLSSNMHKVLALFTLFIIIPLIFFTQNLSLGIERFTRFLVWILAFYSFYDIFKYDYYRAKFNKYIYIMIWFMLVSYFMSLFLYEYFGISLKPESEIFGYQKLETTLTFTGFFNTIATFSYILLFMLILLQLSTEFYKIKRSKYIFLFWTISFLILISLVRAPIVALMIILFYSFRNNKLQFLSISILVFFLLFSLFGSNFSKKVLADRVFDEVEIMQGQKADIYKLGSGRMGMWLSVYDHLKNQNIINLVLGSGFDADYVATTKYWIGSARAAHNDLLEVSLNFGFISLLLFLAFLRQIWRYCFKLNPKYFDEMAIKKSKAIFFAVIAILMLQGILTTIFMFYFSLAIVFSYWEIRHKIYIQVKNKNNEHKNASNIIK